MKKVLVIYKKSVLEYMQRHPQSLKQLKKNNKGLYDKFVKSDMVHEKSVNKVLSVLEENDLQVKTVFRAGPHQEEKADLVVSIGGDGTLLESARFNKETPIISVNSDPSNSVAHYSACHAGGFSTCLKQLGTRELPLRKVSRLKVSINQNELSHMVLNDVLLAHRNPAHSTRFILNSEGKKHRYKCSGLWVSTASGSTAAIGSAGAKQLPFLSKRWQFLVREPYGDYEFARGLLEEDEDLNLFCNMENTCLYFDGPHHREKLNIGDNIRISKSPWPLKLYRP